ncbi:hypothetical protein GCM10018980_45020 [Streptomyces capoamus]|uniref:Uncharacterized protein n=1 Tax=Streptomyces capoamus TaxID=68183 RepID=A0A919EYA1_9ACTN|nr:hypothetical protein GCM10010501_63280 [Streptomyces libani subsp. rufus]GHG58092.1 hypothetical protein GCM10018980_45020 [Streptomyces capoamus]
MPPSLAHACAPVVPGHRCRAERPSCPVGAGTTAAVPAWAGLAKLSLIGGVRINYSTQL